ncbi:hypothetical protein O3M35_008472 [Rhynocoris fuscipes]|uniref:Nucleolar protein 6 n=1 Tax=Rhynocoris fuscipes TaxID=488301 RepID=A0AAW1DBN3_9HEMI
MKKKQKSEVQSSDSEDVEESEQDTVSDPDEGYDDNFAEMENKETDTEDDDAEDNSGVPYKRKNEDNENKTTKKRKHDIKAPTAEEMIRLKETENLYQSNLFRLQIEEMINELKPRKTDKNAIKHWIVHFKQFLLNLEDAKEVSIKDHMRVRDNFKLPLPQKRWDIDGKINFFKPLNVEIVGSYSNGTVMGPYFVLDVVLIIPKKYFHKDDYLNQKYHYKRAVYLCLIASAIQGSHLVSKDHEMKFCLNSEDPLKPMLLFRPEGRMTQFVEVALSILPEDNPFKLNRFLPEKNNIRPEWWGLERKSSKLPPTPYYNMSILEDIVAAKNERLKNETFEGNQNLRDAIVLLSVWLKQRDLFEGYGAFNLHILSMLVVYLVKTQKISNYMSSYQISRNVWLALALTDWSSEGISLYQEDEEGEPCSLGTFHSYFQIVFIDCTGLYNLCCRLDQSIYLRVRAEAEKAIKFLNNPTINSFQALFTVNMPFIQQYDHYMSLPDSEIIENTVAKYCDEEKLMDYSGHALPLFIRTVNNLFVQGLGNRLNYFCIKPLPYPKWNLYEQCPNNRLNEVLVFGMKLNPETALTVLEKGPSADDEKAKQFREFWGDQCELRRFRDGTVCEAVCWHNGDATLNDRRLITKKIVQFLLNKKLDISHESYNYIANQFDSLVVNKIDEEKSNEEASQIVHRTYEKLSQQLRDITEIPLSIVSVRCISPVYRFTDVFPPLPVTKHFVNKKVCNYSARGVVFKTDTNISEVPLYVEPIDLVLQMSMSQKWPNDVKAGKRLIAAFNIVIASSLKKNYGLNCQVNTDYITVQKDDYIFRLHLGYSKEIGLLKQQISAEGVTYYRDTPESIVLEKKFINLPKITGALYGLSQTYSGYGFATCLAKRWINSHLLDDFHFPAIAIELLMARLFVTPQPYEVPVQPLTAFLRFLNFIATTNWHIEPIVVNFNKLLTREQVTDIEKSFHSNRDNLPAMVIATPYDLAGTLWTKDAPTLPTLIRLSKLAITSLKMLDVLLTTAPTHHNIMKVFNPPLSHYDAIITLKKKLLPRRLQFIGVKLNDNITRSTQLPITGFDPAAFYLQELRERYGDYALFFHDTYGGTVIGVLFKPNFLETCDFKVSNVGPRTPNMSDDKTSLIPNKEVLINGFYIVGKDLVESIKVNE